MIKTLKERPFSYFESENVKGKNGAYAGSEWTPYNLSVIKQWIDMRDNYSFTDSEEDIYGGDWEQLDIKEYHSKYGTNYIYIDNDRMLWRIKMTGDEFYNNNTYRRPKPSIEQAKKTLEELYKEKLIETIEYEMQQIGNTNVSIENIRLFNTEEKQYALADISYIWWLNAWDKKVKHSDAIFVLVDDEWKSPLFA